jgi:hypothetical protein
MKIRIHHSVFQFVFVRRGFYTLLFSCSYFIVLVIILKMPKITKNSRIKQYISEFGENVFLSDGKILFCKFCETKINTDTRYLVTQHLKTEKHKSAVKRKQDQMKNKSQQLVFTAMTSKKSSFKHDLCTCSPLIFL